MTITLTEFIPVGAGKWAGVSYCIIVSGSSLPHLTKNIMDC